MKQFLSIAFGALLLYGMIRCGLDNFKEYRDKQAGTSTTVSSSIIGTWVAPQKNGRYMDEMRFIDSDTCQYFAGDVNGMLMEYSYTISGTKVIFDGDSDDIWTLDGSTLTNDSSGRVFRKR